MIIPPSVRIAIRALPWGFAALLASTVLGPVPLPIFCYFLRKNCKSYGQYAVAASLNLSIVNVTAIGLLWLLVYTPMLLVWLAARYVGPEIIYFPPVIAAMMPAVYLEDFFSPEVIAAVVGGAIFVALVISPIFNAVGNFLVKLRVSEQGPDKSHAD